MSSADLKKLQHNLQTASALMANKVQFENVAIFIGTTKSGKSSLINYLIGNNLIGHRDTECMPIVINKTDKSFGPEIGRGPSSETVVPTRWENKETLPDLALWDSAGFDDNRGPVPDITGAYYTYELFKNVKSIKIVLVTDINDIAHSKINPFVGMLHAVENLLGGNMRDYFSSIIVIFTKVPDVLNDVENVNKELIGKILKFQVLSSSSINISDTTKDFVKYLIENNNNMGLFRKAKAGNISSNIEVGIVEAINGAASVSDETLKNSVTPSIADGSKVYLYNVRQKLFSLKAFKEFEKILSQCFDKELKRFNDIIQTEATKENLYSIKCEMTAQADQLKKILESDFTFEKKLYTLQMIDSRIETHLGSNQLLENSKLMAFVDRLLNLWESKHFDVNLQQIIRSIVSGFEKAIVDVKFKLHEINKDELEAQTSAIKDNYLEAIQRLETELKAINDHNQSVKKDLGMFGKIGDAVDETIDTAKTYAKALFSKWFG